MEKLYIGIDLHSASFQVCAMTADGTPRWEARFERDTAGIAQFCARCPPSRYRGGRSDDTDVAFCRCGRAGRRERVRRRSAADAIEGRLRGQNGSPGCASVGGCVAPRQRGQRYHPPLPIRELRELCRSRQVLVRTRTMLIQRVRAILLRHGVREARQRLTRRTGLAWLASIELPPAARAAVTRLQDVLEVVSVQTRATDTAVAAAAAADPIVRALMAIPGVGPVIGLTVRAEIGAIDRFPTAPQLASYAGLVPRVERSARHAWTGPITKRGSPWLRWALVEAALHGPRRRSYTYVEPLRRDLFVS